MCLRYSLYILKILKMEHIFLDRNYYSVTLYFDSEIFQHHMQGS